MTLPPSDSGVPTASRRIPSHPIYSALVQFPAVCFTLALFTDIAFWRTNNLMWQNFSAWLLFAGLVFGGLAVLGALLRLIFRRREPGLGWAYTLSGLVVLALAFVNSFVHGRDGWTAVVPTGLALSAATVLVMLVTAWLGRQTVYRSVGVSHA